MARAATFKARGHPTPAKAGKMLRHGKVRGKKLSKKQKRLFGMIHGSKKLPTRLNDVPAKYRKRVRKKKAK